jgi:hydroxyacylglutathione hydrolase
VLDTRPFSQYGAGHVPGSLHISLTGQFASWAGSLIRPNVPVIFVTEEESRVREAQTRLARVGLENITGYLEGGILAWNRAGLPLATTEQISVEELRHRIDEQSVDIVVDVRRPPEWNAGHIAGAVHHPLNHLDETFSGTPRESRVAVVCAGGFRSSIGTSILEQLGFNRITNVVGGMTAWNNAKLPVTV